MPKRHDIDKATEESLYNLLLAGLPGTVRSYVPWHDGQLQFPCAIPRVVDVSPLSEEAEFHAARMLNVDVGVFTERGKTDMQTAREIHAETVNAVCIVLKVSTLLADLQTAATSGVGFSMAGLLSEQPATEDGNKRLMTVISLEIIAEPLEVA